MRRRAHVATLAGALAATLVAVACTGTIDSSGDGDGDGAGGADAGPGAGNADASPNQGALEHCVTETNRFRALAGKPALLRSTALETYATQGAEYDTTMMSAHAHFAATSGGGIAQAENECPSFLGWTLGAGGEKGAITDCLQAFYDEGPGGGHYDNMMADHVHVGCGTYIAGNGITIIQDLGP